MRAPLSISLRLGLLFAAIAAAIFVVVGVYLYLTLSRQMSARDDAELLNKAVLVRQLLRTLPAEERGPRQLQGMLGRVIGQDGVLLRVATPQGRVLVGPPADAVPALPAVAAAPVPSGREPLRADIATGGAKGQPSMRVLDLLADSGEGPLRVTLARLRSDRLAILRRYAFDLLGALAAGTLLATALGFVAVRRGLRPLYGMVAETNAITAQRLDTRLRADAMPAELRALGVAFNAMLDRLEDGVQRLSGFAADLAHDLRTPVNALMMQTQVALSRERGADEYQALLASSLEEYEHLSRMIENTLFLARADNAQLALARAALDVRAELAHIRDYFEVLAEDGGVALTVGDTPAAPLHADPVLLRRAIGNLVSNALAHTPRGGAIRLDARLDARPDGAWLELAVANTGGGIAHPDADKLFGRYYRGDPARASGTPAGASAGLGLAIVRAIMRLHGGSADIGQGRPGETVFVLRFPAGGAHADENTPA